MKPYNNEIVAKELPIVLSKIKEHIYEKIVDFDIIEYSPSKEPLKFNEPKQFIPISIGDKWGNLFDCAWFHLRYDIPPKYQKCDIAFRIDISGEGCMYKSNGQPYKGITSVTTTFDEALGKAGKRIVLLNDELKNGHNIYIDAGCNDLFGKYQRGELLQADICVCHNDIREVYYDMLILYETLQTLDKNSARYYKILYALNDASNIFNEYSASEIIEVKKILSLELNRKNCDSPLKFTAIGHAHLDLAWLWPIRETKRKAVRTFTNVLESFDRYEYVFGASQPQQFQWIKEAEPQLFERIVNAVKENKIELQGAMWVEPDLNISSGESLVRQIMYGSQFYEREFGYSPDNLWLPDVFGFNGAIPQIAKLCGIEKLLTIKLSWNTINEFPYHSFIWRGIDGSEVLVHMPPEGTYNSECAPSSLALAERKYHEKGITDEALVVFGIGDGGGGPSPIHLERLRRLENLQGVAPVKAGKATEFFDRLAQYKDKLNTYQGELYLEKHQGTYTTEAKNKYYNRKMENLLRTAEAINALVNFDGYPLIELEKIWKEVLLYEFHDILPGSSIGRVYEESVARYRKLEENLNDIITRAGKATNKHYFNASPFATSKIIDNKLIECNAYSTENNVYSVPECTLKQDVDTMENDFLVVRFGDNGEITQLSNKKNDKNFIKRANILNVYGDDGDAWDLDTNYLFKKLGKFELVDCKLSSGLGKIIRTQKFVFNNSSLTQKIELSALDKAISIYNDIDWKETHKMLRCDAMHNVNTSKIKCDIQFGNIERATTENNSHDTAMHEIAFHKWATLQEKNMGFSLISDCKYGLRAKGQLLSLNVLRSTTYPDEHADVGKQYFGYQLYPFMEKNETEKIGYEFNNPLVIIDYEVNCGISSLTENIVIETIKKANDGNGIIVRMYENSGYKTSAIIKAPKNSRCAINNLLEKHIEDINFEGDILLDFSPFEIKTLRIVQ